MAWKRARLNLMQRKECDISVDHLYKWAMREVEMWVLRVAPRQPEDKKKYHGTIRDMIPASSFVLLYAHLMCHSLYSCLHTSTPSPETWGFPILLVTTQDPIRLDRFLSKHK